MFVAAIVSFFSFMLIVSHLPERWLRRVAGYKGITDLLLHGSILYMFWATSTEGLLQAEAAGICFSLWLRGYRKLLGYERFTKPAGERRYRWVRFTGHLNRSEARP